ncbi:hypothetical protein HJFPF1_12314 [Paramyrothecium foliicola]|nr:hypothetical protein HJFPF1_12314 [Paramyrothecium foliicola]
MTENISTFYILVTAFSLSQRLSFETYLDLLPRIRAAIPLESEMRLPAAPNLRYLALSTWHIGFKGRPRDSLSVLGKVICGSHGLVKVEYACFDDPWENSLLDPAVNNILNIFICMANEDPWNKSTMHATITSDGN